MPLIQKIRQFSGKESGLALVLVMSMIAVVIAIVAEIVFQSEVTVRSTIGERDRVRAEMAAMSGAELAKLLVFLEVGINSLKPEMKQMVKMQLNGLSISKLMNGLPIGAEAIESAKELGQARMLTSLDPNLLEVLKNVPGYFVIEVSNESAKLNLNMLAKPDTKSAMKDQLERVFSRPREARFLEQKGYPPERLMSNVLDYLDKNTTDELDQSDESLQYQQKNFKHRPKNAPFESLEELRRVPGFHDDEIFALFSPYFTVWPMLPEEKALDVNEVPVELLSSLMTEKSGDLNQQTMDTIEDQRAEGESATDQRQLADWLGKLGLSNENQLKRIATFESTVYRVEVQGTSNGIERTYIMVIEKIKPKKGEKPVRVVYQRFL